MASLGVKVRLAALPLVLATAGLSGAGCAGPQIYVPLEQRTQVSAETRWQALESVAKREQWNVVLTDPKSHAIVAYSNSAGSKGVRDVIRVQLWADRTVVETRTEVENQGLWQDSADRCEHYSFSREKLLAAQIDGRQSTPLTLTKGSEVAAR